MLDEMVAQYSNMFHSSIKMTPVQASEKKNEAEVYRNLYPVGEEIKTPKFAIGDLERITKKKNMFGKGYTPRWTEEVFTMSEVTNIYEPYNI